MTCVIGFVDENKRVWMGADSAGTNSYLQQSIRTDTKVFKIKDFIFGFAGSFRMGQILKYHFRVPPRLEGMSDEEYIYTDFLDSLIACLVGNNYAQVKENRLYGGVFLFGYNGKLYEVQSDFQIGQVYEPFNAIGCGDDLAKGCLYGIYGLAQAGTFTIDPDNLLELALNASSNYSAGVAQPFVIDHVDPPKSKKKKKRRKKKKSSE